MGLFITGAPAALADHESADGFVDHFRVHEDTLEPGAEHRLPIQSASHGDLRAGWIYILHAIVDGNHSLQASLQHKHEPVAEYTWHHDTPTTGYTKIQSTGAHELVITNPGEQAVDYRFYYDQSCNCEGKMIPLEGGSVMFNYPLPAGSEIQLSYPVVRDWHLKATLATYDETLASADWPQDFQILEEQEAEGPGNGISGQRWMNFTIAPPANQMYYVHIEALNGGSPQEPVMLSAIFDVHAEREAPAPLVLPMILLALGLLTLGRRFTSNV